MNVFSNPSIQSTFNQINGRSFDNLVGFGIYSSSNTTYYYVMDYGANLAWILNDEWKFISVKSYSWVSYMISIGLYLTSDYKVSKVD